MEDLVNFKAKGKQYFSLMSEDLSSNMKDLVNFKAKGEQHFSLMSEDLGELTVLAGEARGC